MRPHNLPLVMIGAGILWFDWFGFNAGSALSANGQAAEVFVTTLVATAASVLGWLLVEKLRDGHPTSLGAASGVVAGLVAITPACSSVTPLGALAVGAVAGVLCALAVGLKFTVGLFASATTTAGVDGLVYGGGVDQLGRQAIGALAVLVYSFVLAYAIGFVIEKTVGFRLDEEAELEGIDGVEHAESAYDCTTSGGGGGRTLTGGSAPLPKTEDRSVNA